MTNCDIRIWHTLAEVQLFVFLFVIKLFLNCCCSIDVLYIVFADVTGFGIIDILRRQCHVEVIRVTAFESRIGVGRFLPYFATLKHSISDVERQHESF